MDFFFSNTVDNLFLFSTIFLFYITYGSNIVKPFSLKFSYSIYGSIISAISVLYLLACLSTLSLLLFISPVLDIVLEILENDLRLFINFMFIFYSKSISLGLLGMAIDFLVFPISKLFMPFMRSSIS